MVEEGRLIHREIERLCCFDVRDVLIGYPRGEWGPPLDRLIRKYSVRGDASGACYYRSRLRSLQETLAGQRATVDGLRARIDAQDLPPQEAAESLLDLITVPGTEAAPQEAADLEALTKEDRGPVAGTNVLMAEAIVRAHNATEFVYAEEGLRDVDFSAQPMEARRRPPRGGVAYPV